MDLGPRSYLRRAATLHPSGSPSLVRGEIREVCAVPLARVKNVEAVVPHPTEHSPDGLHAGAGDRDVVPTDRIYPPLPQKSVCMSITMSAVLWGRKIAVVGPRHLDHPRLRGAHPASARSMRDHGFHVLHTREGHRADLSDLPANKRWRSEGCRVAAAADRDRGPRSMRPRPHPRRAWVADHPRASADRRRAHHRQARQGLVLRNGPRHGAPPARVRNIVLTGITTDVCVHTTMRDANDRAMNACSSLTAARRRT